MNPNTKAILLTVEGVVRPLFISSIADVDNAIGCAQFDIVRLGRAADIFVDDEGLLTGKPINLLASAIATELTGHAINLAGDAIVFGHDGQGGSIDCPSWLFDMFDEAGVTLEVEEITTKGAKYAKRD
jgi:hypothetical protein